MSFDKLRKSRVNSLQAIQSQIESLKPQNSRDEESIHEWKLTLDKAGNGYAVVRFLPASENYPYPFAKVYNHGFKNEQGKWFIENCLTTQGKPCPVCEANSVLWNTNEKEKQEIARGRKRKLSYYANILILEDPQNPDNVGKVKIYRFGAKIMAAIEEAINPKFADEKAINPFDLWEDGADFKIKVRTVEDYPNYDRCEFSPAAALYKGDEAKLEAVYNQIHDLSGFVAETKFKSYEDLKQKFDAHLGNTSTTSERAERPKSTVAAVPKKEPSESVKSVVKQMDNIESSGIDDVSDDDLSFLDT